jgi:hypothetical protein
MYAVKIYGYWHAVFSLHIWIAQVSVMFSLETWISAPKYNTEISTDILLANICEY